MTCQACAEFAANSQSHSFYPGCTECIARGLSRSPIYWNAAQADAMTPSYRHALQNAFGENWKAGHARVKHYAEMKQ
jgi:hypothetical protein